MDVAMSFSGLDPVVTAIIPLPTRPLYLGRQEGSKAPLQEVGAATDGVGGVAVVGALAVEAEVARGGDEECFEQVALSQGVDVAGDVQGPAGDGDGASEPEEPQHRS